MVVPSKTREGDGHNAFVE